MFFFAHLIRLKKTLLDIIFKKREKIVFCTTGRARLLFFMHTVHTVITSFKSSSGGQHVVYRRTWQEIKTRYRSTPTRKTQKGKGGMR